MAKTARLKPRRWYQLPSVWIAIIVLLYTVLGVFLVPKVVQDQTRQAIESFLGWQTHIEQVRFNPFTFELDVQKLDVQEADQTQLSFDSLHINLNPAQLVQGVIEIEEISLNHPFVRFELDRDGNNNFSKALAAHPQPESPEPETNEAPTTTPNILLKRLLISEGNTQLSDHSQGEPMMLAINPINFHLDNFSTQPAKDGTYSLSLDLGDDQEIHWQGQFGVAPLRSSGLLELTNLNPRQFWAYAKAHSPYDLRQARLDISGQYQLDSNENGLDLRLSNGRAQVRKMALATDSQSSPFVTLDRLDIGPVEFDLKRKLAAISGILLSGLDLQLERDTEGRLLPLVALDKSTTARTKETTPVKQADSAPDNNTEPFQWAIQEIRMENSRLAWLDQTLPNADPLLINPINVRLQGLSQDFSKPIQFDLNLQPQHSGTHQVQGLVTPEPLLVRTKFNLHDFALKNLQPYVQTIAHLAIENGLFSTDGQLTLRQTDANTLEGEISAQTKVTELAITDLRNGNEFLSWQALDITPIQVNLSPLMIDVGDITLTQAKTGLRINEQRQTNFQAVMIAQKNPDEHKTTEPSDEESSAEVSASPDIRIGRIKLDNAEIGFADLSLEPHFSTVLTNLTGEISGLSSENLSRADVRFTGEFDRQGKLSIDGKLNPLSEDLYTDLSVLMRDISMPNFSPYTVRYIGQTIDKGKVNMNLNYKISENALKGDNKVKLQQFELGKSVPSEHATNLPVGLAVALLKDRKGVIDIDLPVTGRLDDPGFKIGRVLLNALTNLISKAATAPFSLLGSLIPGGGESLSQVAWPRGQSSFSTETSQTLDQLGQALVSRPNLLLEIRSQANMAADGESLRQQKLEALLTSKKLSREQALSQAAQTLLGDNAYQQFNAGFTKPFAQMTSDEKSHYHEQLMHILQSKMEIKEVDFRDLAKARTSSVFNYLVAEAKVPESQLFILDPDLEGAAEPAHSQFSLAPK